MKLLIVYGTTEGQTRKICTFLRDEAHRAGHQAELADASDSPRSPDGFDEVIVAASVHANSYQTSVKHYVRKYREALNSVPGVFISVSLTAVTDEPESWKELEQVTERFLQETGWHPLRVEQTAGALRYTEYNFFKKFIMRMIARKSGGDTDTSTDYEYTDWEKLKNLLKDLELEFSKSQKNISS